MIAQQYLPRAPGGRLAALLAAVLVDVVVAVAPAERRPVEDVTAAAVAQRVGDAPVGVGATHHHVAARRLLDEVSARGTRLADARHRLLRRLVGLGRRLGASVRAP